MKKMFLYVTVFSLIFFSCKSTDSLAKDSESTSKNLIPSYENSETATETENQSIDDTSIDDTDFSDTAVGNIDDAENVESIDNTVNKEITENTPAKNNSNSKFRPYAVFDEYFKGENENTDRKNLAQNSAEDWKDDVILSPFAIVDEITLENTENDAEEILNQEQQDVDSAVIAQINPQDETGNTAPEIVLDQDESDADGERIIIKEGNAVISELLPFENEDAENIEETAGQETQTTTNEPQETQQTGQQQQLQNTATNTQTEANAPQVAQQAQPATNEQPAQVPTSQIATQPVQTQNTQNVINTTPIPTTPTVAQQPTRQAQTATTQTSPQQPQTAQPAATTSPAANRTQEPAQRQSSRSYEQIITDGEQENAGGEEEIDENTGIAPSRSVTVDLGAYLDVEYPGSGWIYIGEEDNTENMLFFGRKLGGTTTSFTLRSRKSGTSLLHFYKNDLLTGKYIDDYLEVVITDKQVENSSSHTIAPAYAMVVPPRPSRARDNAVAQIDATPENTVAMAETRKNEKTSEQINTPETERPASTTARTAIQTPSQTPQQPQEQNRNQLAATQAQPVVTEQNEQQAEEAQTSGKDAAQLLSEAQRLYDEKKFNDALKMLNSFFDIAESHIDEGLFLQGQILESNSEVRNIKEAIDSYGILINNWPDSRLWQEAQRRYIYLKRFYINIH